MNATLKHLLVAGSACLGLSMAHAADTSASAPTDQGVLSSQQARDLKTESKAEYKARKKVADANHDLNVAECKTSGLESKDIRDCKHDAKQISKDAKKDAKQIYKDDKAAIKANKE